MLCKIIKDGKPFEISMIKNYAVKCNIRAKITNYLKQTDKCHKLLNEGVSETLRNEILNCVNFYNSLLTQCLLIFTLQKKEV